MKKLLFIGGVLAASLAGCASHTSQNQTAKSPADAVIVSPAVAPPQSDKASVTKLIFSSQPQKPEAGQSARWTLKIEDAKSGAPIQNFKIAHDKLLHLIVVSKDLSLFVHLHPKYLKDGVFEIEAALPHAGSYKLFADYTLSNGAHEVSPHDLKIGGANPLPAQPKLVANAMHGDWMTITALAHDEGAQPAAGAEKYQVALMPMPFPLIAGQAVMLHFQVRDASGKPVPNLQPYLGAQGHLVILSSDASTYLHAHPMEAERVMTGVNHDASTPAHGESGSEVMFHTEFPRAGFYKAWAQFRRNGEIITAPFVLKVEAAKAMSASTPSSKKRVTIELPGGYKNSAATVRAGEPTQITFILKKEAGCGDTVVMPAAKWRKTLKVGQSASLDYTPQKSGVLRFACGENMYKGTILVQ